MVLKRRSFFAAVAGLLAAPFASKKTQREHAKTIWPPPRPGPWGAVKCKLIKGTCNWYADECWDEVCLVNSRYINELSMQIVTWEHPCGRRSCVAYYPDGGLVSENPQVLDDEKRLMDAMETAWAIIANAYGSDWSLASTEWREAAERWRDEQWHPALTRYRESHPRRQESPVDA